MNDVFRREKVLHKTPHVVLGDTLRFLCELLCLIKEVGKIRNGGKRLHVKTLLNFKNSSNVSQSYQNLF